MQPTPEQLEAYWAANPDALAAAIANDPTAFELGSTDGFYTSQRATNRAGVDDLNPFNSVVSGQLDTLAKSQPTREEYEAYQTQLRNRDNTATMPMGSYDPAAIQEAANVIKAQADQMGVRLFTQDGGKGYFYNTGVPELNTALYGDAWQGANSFGTQPGTYESAQYSADFGDYAKAVAPTLIATALTGPLAGTISSATGLGTAASTGLSSGLLSAGSQLATTGSVDPQSILSAAAGGGLTSATLNALPKNPLTGWYNADTMKGDFTQGLFNDAVSQFIEDGGVSGTDALKAGAATAGTRAALDIVDDAISTRSPDALLANGMTVNGVPFSDLTPEMQEQLTSSTDIRGLLGENGILNRLGFDTEWIDTEGVYNVIDAFGNVVEKIPGGVGSLNAVVNVADAIGLLPEQAPDYDQRFDAPWNTPTSENSTLTGVWTDTPRNAQTTGWSLENTQVGRLSTGGYDFDLSLPASDLIINPTRNADEELDNIIDRATGLEPDIDFGELSLGSTEGVEPIPQNAPETTTELPTNTNGLVITEYDELPPGTNPGPRGDLLQNNENDELPAGGGDGGGGVEMSGGSGRTPNSPWEDFYAVPDFQWELLNRQQIPMQNYLAGLFTK